MYAVEVWRYGERWRFYICRKEDIPRFISHTIEDYDKGECAYRIYRIFFYNYTFCKHMKEISFRQKMKFLKQARQ